MRALEQRLETVCREWKPTLLHAHSPMLVGLPALRVARRLRIPLVYEVRDLWENASVDRGKFRNGSLLYRAARTLETRVLRNADAVVTICEKLRDELAPRARAGRIFVVGNGVDIDSFQPTETSPEARRRWGLEGKHVLGYVGTFQPYEGLEDLIAALPGVLKSVPQAHLLITGSGGVEERLRYLVGSLDLADHVTFTGRLPHDEVAQAYQAADVMAYPRILTRTTALTTPLKPLEAMAMGKPVIVSDVPAMLELVRPGETGLVFHAGDMQDLSRSCAELLGNPLHQAQLGHAAREWVLQERQWSKLVANYDNVYAVAASPA